MEAISPFMTCSRSHAVLFLPHPICGDSRSPPPAPGSKGPCLSMKECQYHVWRRACMPEFILVWTSLENRISHTCTQKNLDSYMEKSLKLKKLSEFPENYPRGDGKYTGWWVQ